MKAVKSNIQHHYFRTILATYLASLAVMLIITSVMVVWLSRTLTDTDTYVSTVAPLVNDADVQAFSVEKVSDLLIENDDAPVRDIATGLLGVANVNGKNDEQLRAEVRPIVDETIRGIVTGPTFAQLWESSNREVHESLISQLDSEALTAQLNFQPLITGIVTSLEGTKLAIAQDKLEIKPDNAVVTIEREQLASLRYAYRNTKKSMILVVLAAVALTAAAIAVSVHHLKTLRRVAFVTGILTGLMSIGLSAASWVKPTDEDQLQEKFGLAVFRAFTHDLRVMLIVISGACLVGVIGSTIYTLVMARRTLAK